MPTDHKHDCASQDLLPDPGPEGEGTFDERGRYRPVCDCGASSAAQVHDRSYLERTIETVRNHRDADNCWPSWANVFADEIERLWAENARLQAKLAEYDKYVAEFTNNA